MVMCTVPFAFLAGLLRSRVAGVRGERGGRTPRGPDHPPERHRPGTRRRTRRHLLEAAYLDPDGGYVDAAGRQVAVPRGSRIESRSRWRRRRNLRRCSRTHGSREGEQELVRAVTAAATLALENERLASELRGKVDEVIASRARIVESGDAARRRLERDLHDGAQQRLVSLALNLRVLGSRVDADPDAARQLEVRHELDQALEDLRSSPWPAPSVL